LRQKKGDFIFSYTEKRSRKGTYLTRLIHSSIKKKFSYWGTRVARGIGVELNVLCAVLTALFDFC